MPHRIESEYHTVLLRYRLRDKLTLQVACLQTFTADGHHEQVEDCEIAAELGKIATYGNQHGIVTFLEKHGGSITFPITTGMTLNQIKDDLHLRHHIERKIEKMLKAISEKTRKEKEK